jgi:hypothetical protein
MNLETFYYLPKWFRKPQRAQSTQRKIRTLCDLHAHRRSRHSTPQEVGVLCALCGEYFIPRFINPEYIKKSLNLLLVGYRNIQNKKTVSKLYGIEDFYIGYPGYSLNCT